MKGQRGLRRRPFASRLTTGEALQDVPEKSLAAGIALGAFAPTSLPVAARDKGVVGIAMSTKSSARWISHGESAVKFFEDVGYKTDLQYAEDDIPNQFVQIENMIAKGADVLAIAGIDGATLQNAPGNAAAAGIKVIARDRQLRDSASVDCYATFDNFQVGVIRATALVDGLAARFPDVKPRNVELFGGSSEGNTPSSTSAR